MLPGAQQEGLTFDPSGNLWVADDRAGILLFKGARARIAAEIKATHAALAESEPSSISPS